MKNKVIFLIGTIVIPVLIYANEFPICVKPTHQAYPRLAWNGKNFLAVWMEGFDLQDTMDVYGRIITKNGGLGDTVFAITTKPFDQFSPTVIYGDNRFLVGWLDYGDYTVYGQFISDSGTLIGTVFPISDSGTSDSSPAFAWNGMNYLAVWHDDRNSTFDNLWDIYGQLISNCGTLIDTNFPISKAQENQKYPKVSSDSVNFFVVWQDYRQNPKSAIYGQLISGNGTLIDTNFSISAVESKPYSPSIIWGNTRYFVVWLDYRRSATDSVMCHYGQFVSNNGSLIDTNFSITVTSKYIHPPKLAYNDTNYLLVWEEGSPNSDVCGCFISKDGKLIDSAFAISATPVDQGSPDVVWGDANYLVVWQDERAGNFDIYGSIIPNYIGVNEEKHNISREIKLFPNPFLSYTRIITPAEEIQIYDISGKFLKKINNGIWNGKDMFNREAPQGIYFVKAKGYKLTKIVKIR